MLPDKIFTSLCCCLRPGSYQPHCRLFLCEPLEVSRCVHLSLYFFRVAPKWMFLKICFDSTRFVFFPHLILKYFTPGTRIYSYFLKLTFLSPTSLSDSIAKQEGSHRSFCRFGCKNFIFLDIWKMVFSLSFGSHLKAN